MAVPYPDSLRPQRCSPSPSFRQEWEAGVELIRENVERLQILGSRLARENEEESGKACDYDQFLHGSESSAAGILHCENEHSNN